MWQAARKLLPRPLPRLPWLLTIIAVMGASADHFFPMIAVLFLVSYFVGSERSVTPTVLILAAVLAASSLVKINLFLQALVVGGAVSLDQAIRGGRFRFIVPLVYIISLAGFYLAAGQHLGNFPAFVLYVGAGLHRVRGCRGFARTVH